VAAFFPDFLWLACLESNQIGHGQARPGCAQPENRWSQSGFYCGTLFAFFRKIYRSKCSTGKRNACLVRPIVSVGGDLGWVRGEFRAVFRECDEG
jgi:hypothetical protein